MKLWREFKTFAVRGNVVDMAVGIVIGAAFGKIVSSLVGDVITPPLGLMLGGADFADLAVTLKAGNGDRAAVTLGYGKFLQTVFDFLIVAAAVFAVVRVINRLKLKEEVKPPPAPPQPSQEQILLKEIRDILKERRI